MKSYRLIYSDLIKKDIDAVFDYIVNEYKTQIVADSLIDSIIKKVEQISESPYVWSLLEDPNLASKGYRTCMVKKYKLFYVINEDCKNVLLIRFLHSSRDWLNILNNDGKNILK